MPNKKVGNTMRRKAQKKGRRKLSKRVALPPATSLLGHIMRTIVQGVWDIAQGALRSSAPPEDLADFGLNKLAVTPAPPNHWLTTDMDEGYLFPGGWLDRYKGLFNEYKVHRIVAHYMPYAAYGTPGEYVFALWDCGQNFSPNNFEDCIGMPASVVRKSYQPAVLDWFPTEPDDKNWHTFGDKHVWCSSAVFASESSYKVQKPSEPGKSTFVQDANVAGKVTIDVSASFRGKCKKGQPGLDSPSGSKEFRQYSDFISCDCRKCRSVVRRKALVSWQNTQKQKSDEPRPAGSVNRQDWVYVNSASNFG